MKEPDPRSRFMRPVAVTATIAAAGMLPATNAAEIVAAEPRPIHKSWPELPLGAPVDFTPVTAGLTTTAGTATAYAHTMARTPLSEDQLAGLEQRHIEVLNRGGSTHYPPTSRCRYQLGSKAGHRETGLERIKAALRAVGADDSDVELVEPRRRTEF